MIDAQLIHGDFLEKIKDIPDDSIDLVLTDPPYGTTHLEWDSVIDFKVMWRELERVRKPNAPVMLFGIEPFSTKLRMSNLDNWHHDAYWKKIGMGCVNMFKVHFKPARETEIVSVFCYSRNSTYNHGVPKGAPVRLSLSRRKAGAAHMASHRGLYNHNSGEIMRSRGSKRFPREIISFNREMNPVHPTQKPVALLEYLLKIYSNPGDTVLDFTMGSGSTGVACVKTGRNFVGIEIDDNYFKIAKDRIENA